MRSLFFSMVVLLIAGMLLLAACGNQPSNESDISQVQAVLETEPVPSEGDAADDVAIWVHPHSAAQSVIIATDKDSGLVVYDLRGKVLQHLALGEINNVDLRDGFALDGEQITLIAASNRTDDTLRLLTIDPATRQIRLLSDTPIPLDLQDAYGLCLYHNKQQGRFYVFVTSTGDGGAEQWEVYDRGGEIAARRVRTFTIGSDAEGCVADDRYAILYVSEETKGIWRYGAEPTDGDERILIDKIGGESNLKADIEGLAIYRGASGANYLVASNQGNSEFVVYDRANDYAYLGSFKIAGSAAVDAVTTTDGIDLTSASLGPNFPMGVLIAQDHRNADPSENQNFKLVSWADVAQALDLPDTPPPTEPAESS